MEEMQGAAIGLLYMYVCDHFIANGIREIDMLSKRIKIQCKCSLMAANTSFSIDYVRKLEQLIAEAIG